ncbi:phosphoribosylformylglycinamidine synthase subunit PurQ [Xanthovirga aplysinae]|uniref:phosphoribosylformylglycinamidine synthase subunit PurQ n=1 Tax=Xanthovirga aplysinae TaxID=2529853 RepID=UPI0012BC35CC|nr:phosphoribosylformylglycinamidine synthase subunit PurQ [Xanthovirga aplysinae]MTI31754.1 phosphoribosylformylglycinamidine synthase subunit PurQ [Xanthovirga aplysinae]
MKFGVVVFPGSNCDEDMIYVLQSIMKQEVVKLWHKDTDLQGCDFIVLPGGFSYGDYLRSGAIARFSPIMEKVIDHANNGGYLLGICNGFQILTEAGLLPGALLRNKDQKFICKNTYIKAANADSALTKNLNLDKAYKIPVAHAEGRYFASEAELKTIEENGQVLFRYSDENGNLDDTFNINGSLNNIAGVMNKNKNVFGMMPHPERAADNALANTDGKAIFDSILSYIG